MTIPGNIAIVGVGLIGGSLGMAVRTHGVASGVIGIGRNPVALQQAVQLGAIDRFTTDLAEGVRDASVVVLATPIPHILATLDQLPSLLAADAVVTDVGSIKGHIVAAGERWLPGRFIGSHPMAGSEKAGVEAARPDLFVGATWVVTPTDAVSSETTQRIVGLAQAVGANVLTMSPQAHDDTVAVTSHLPHLLAYALASLAGDRATSEPQLYEVAAGSFASGTRVAESSPELWQGICSGNRASVLAALKAYRAELDQLEDALVSGNDTRLRDALQHAHAAHQHYLERKR